jgi:hypothetical protein
VTISHGGRGVAARACGLVNLEPTKVAYVLALCSELAFTSKISAVGLHEYTLKLLNLYYAKGIFHPYHCLRCTLHQEHQAIQ